MAAIQGTADTLLESSTDWFAHPALAEVAASVGYQRDKLPDGPLQLLDRLAELGYRIGKGEDLDLQDSLALGRVEPLDVRVDKVESRSAGESADVALNSERLVDGLHGVSSASGRAESVLTITVEVAVRGGGDPLAVPAPGGRDARTPPHLALKVLRRAVGLTLADVAARIADHFPEMSVSSGTLSAIESGSRGASPRMIQALELAYDIPAGSLTTSYEPRGRVA